MAEWTPDATAYLDAYLRQVDILASSQGDDADDIVSELREHVTREAEGEGVALVTLDMLRKTLSSVGTPEQVTGTDSTVSAPRELPHSDRAPVTPGSLESFFRGRLWDSMFVRCIVWLCLILFLFSFVQYIRFVVYS